MTSSTHEILELFHAWLEEARAHPQISEPTAMHLATVDAEGMPSSRVVLLKAADAEGFTFFTNYQSVKGRALAENPQAALNFYWMPLKKQIRVEGHVVKTDAAASDAYFSSRSRDSQLGAHASAQSEVMAEYDVLVKRFEAVRAAYEGKPIPRPAHWGGYLLTPRRIEFWEERPHRLHNRYAFVRENGVWVRQQLNP